jgi:hypothetical protein
MSRIIPLTRGKAALVDDADYEYLNQFKWHCNTGYAYRSLLRGNRGHIAMHRELMGDPQGMEAAKYYGEFARVERIRK